MVLPARVTRANASESACSVSPKRRQIPQTIPGRTTNCTVKQIAIAYKGEAALRESRPPRGQTNAGRRAAGVFSART